MTTVPEPAHYNGRQQRIRFITGKMGDDLNRKTDSEYSIIKGCWESMHPDASTMTFEDYVRLADEAYRRQHPDQNPAPSRAMTVHSTSGASRALTIRPRESSVHQGSQTVTRGRDHTVESSRRSESNRPGPSHRSSQASKLSQVSHAPGSESSSRVLEKLGLDKPKVSSSQSEKYTVPKSKLFAIDADPDGYGLGTKFDNASKATSAHPKSAMHQSTRRLSQVPEESMSNPSSSKSRNTGTSSRYPTPTAGAAHGLPRIDENSGRHGSSPSTRTTTQASMRDQPSRYGTSPASRYDSTAHQYGPPRGHSAPNYSTMSSGTTQGPHREQPRDLGNVIL